MWAENGFVWEYLSGGLFVRCGTAPCQHSWLFLEIEDGVRFRPFLIAKQLFTCYDRPQNGLQARPQPQNQQNGFPSFAASPAPLDPSSFLLDSPQVAKQMAALTAANQARIAQNSRIAGSPLPPSNGTSSGSYLGVNNNFPPASHDLLTNAANGHANFGMPNNYGLPQAPNTANNPSFLDATMAQPNSARNQPLSNLPLKQRQYGFLQGLHNVMAKRGTPLPPQLTGIPSPGYDPSHSPWNIIEPSKEPGSFMLAGKDVDLFKLWGLVISNGGGQSVSDVLCAMFHV